MKHLYLLWLAPLCALLCACRDEGGGGGDPSAAQLLDVVELREASPTATSFLLYPPQADTAAASAPAVLTSVRALDVPDGLRPGQCCLLLYRLLGEPSRRPYTSGPVAVQALAPITNIGPTLTADTSLWRGYRQDPVYLLALWGAGQKAIMRLLLPYSDQPRRMELVVDTASWTPTPRGPQAQAYLVHSRQPQQQTEPTFDRQYYTAFDLAPYWALPRRPGAITIHLANTNVPSLTRLTLGRPAD